MRAAPERAQELAAGARLHVEIDQHQSRALDLDGNRRLGLGLDGSHTPALLDRELHQ